MKKIFGLLAVSMLLCLGLVAACTGGECPTTIEQTLIKGKITFADSGDVAKWADVTVTCHHEDDGTDYTRTTHSLNNGPWKGWYFVYFPQTQCEAGDEVTVTATKNDLTGTVEGLVEDFLSQRCYDLDLARVDVPLVPEFKTIIGMLTALGALGVFFVVRRSK